MTHIEQRPTLVDFHAAYDKIAHTTIDIFNTDGEITPQMFVFELNPYQEGAFKEIGMIDPEIVHALFSTEESKSQMPHMMTQIFAQIAGPALIVNVVEAWVTSVSEMRHGQLVLNPSSRQEIISVVVHSLKGSKVGQLPILSTPTRHAQYQPLSIMRAEGRTAMASLDDD